jgi:hypothetical protein
MILSRLGACTDSPTLPIYTAAALAYTVRPFTIVTPDACVTNPRSMAVYWVLRLVPGFEVSHSGQATNACRPGEGRVPDLPVFESNNRPLSCTVCCDVGRL